MVKAAVDEAESALNKGNVEGGFKAATKALGLAVHTMAPELMAAGASLTKIQRRMVERTAKEVLKVSKLFGDEALEAVATNLTADMFLCLKETSKALKLAHTAADTFRRLDDKVGEAMAMNTLIDIHLCKSQAVADPRLEMADNSEAKMEALETRRERERDLAMEVAREVASIFHGEGDLKAEAQALNKVAEIYIAKEEPDEAKQQAREVKAIYQELGDVHGEATSLQTVINANLLSEEDFDDALAAAKEMLKMFQGRDRKTDDEDIKAIADALVALSKVHAQRNELKEAADAADEAARLYDDKGEKRFGMAPTLLTLAQIYQQMEGKSAEAVRACKKALEAYKDVQDQSGAAQAMNLAAMIDLDDLFKDMLADPQTYTREQNERMEESWAFLEQAMDIYTEFKNEDGIAAVSATIDSVIERSRKLHVMIAEPIKSIYIQDPTTRTTSVIHIYDTSPPATGPTFQFTDPKGGAAALEDQ
mmetsp:Transcript_119174/g.243718  ORF Transcript_119174/g.243718 Transcript_119174/m.243718 type:complete len:479 (+) Transcript_119174:83-1519(+)